MVLQKESCVVFLFLRLFSYSSRGSGWYVVCCIEHRFIVCNHKFFFLQNRQPPRSPLLASSAASDVYKRQILDISTPKLDGFEVIKRCPPNPNRKYIIFTSMPSSILEGYFKKINVDSYISKQEDIVEIKRKLHQYIDSSETISNDKAGSDDTTAQESDILESLSSRELLVLKYLAQGYRNKEIARELILSEKTVSTYKKRLMDKLCCSSISNLILFAHRNNLL
ncbi:response regulator transcription factor [Vibrio aestuarianus subsp. cardii]|uniref:response regulator transcription factor n=1 Tax=Vibrio aestuarianus TaxID=28171 RepID=UPI001592DBA1|nr:response regulator transcription factor [Vibrio aestuarianus]NGZ65345.1 response regulator transcription factor [Vibrio aestuarianus subsp. cardii]